MKFESVQDLNHVTIQKVTCNHCAHEFTGDHWVSTERENLFKMLTHKADQTVEEQFFTDEGLAKDCYLKEITGNDVKRIEVFNPNGAQIADSSSLLLTY